MEDLFYFKDQLPQLHNLYVHILTYAQRKVDKRIV